MHPIYNQLVFMTELTFDTAVAATFVGLAIFGAYNVYPFAHEPWEVWLVFGSLAVTFWLGGHLATMWYADACTMRRIRHHNWAVNTRREMATRVDMSQERWHALLP